VTWEVHYASSKQEDHHNLASNGEYGNNFRDRKLDGYTDHAFHNFQNGDGISQGKPEQLPGEG
jgi:hypothetical protein